MFAGTFSKGGSAHGLLTARKGGPIQMDRVRGWDEDEDESEGFDTAQICLNGHAINSAVRMTPEFSEKFCKNCGERTIQTCPECQTEIRGHYVGSLSTAAYIPPRFCHNCGKPYPWTSRKLEAAKTYAQDLQTLTPEERVQLAISLDDLVKDTPMAQVSAGRFKRLIAKAGGDAPGFFKEILVGIVSESIKKLIS